MNASRDDHRIVRLEFHRRRTHIQPVGGRRLGRSSDTRLADRKNGDQQNLNNAHDRKLSKEPPPSQIGRSIHVQALLMGGRACVLRLTVPESVFAALFVSFSSVAGLPYRGAGSQGCESYGRSIILAQRLLPERLQLREVLVDDRVPVAADPQPSVRRGGPTENPERVDREE